MLLMRKILLLVCSVIPLSVHAESDDYLIVPGERVGIITKGITEEKLRSILPAKQIRRVLGNAEPPAYFCSTEIFPDSDRKATITWKEPVEYEIMEAIDFSKFQKKCDALPTFTSTAQYIDIEAKSKWHTADGIKIGISLSQLEKINKAPVTIIMTAHEGRGHVADWNNGKVPARISISFGGSLYPNSKKLEKYIEPDGYGEQVIISSKLPARLKSKLYIDSLSVELVN